MEDKNTYLFCGKCCKIRFYLLDLEGLLVLLDLDDADLEELFLLLDLDDADLEGLFLLLDLDDVDLEVLFLFFVPVVIGCQGDMHIGIASVVV